MCVSTQGIDSITLQTFFNFPAIVAALLYPAASISEPIITDVVMRNSEGVAGNPIMIDSHPKQRRRSPRRETMLAAAVSVAGQSVACTVRNISDGGALLQFDQPLCVPFSFVIAIAGESGQRGCEVRHHYGVCVGVEFVSLARISEFSPAVYGGPIGNWIETEQPLSLG